MPPEAFVPQIDCFGNLAYTIQEEMGQEQRSYETIHFLITLAPSKRQEGSVQIASDSVSTCAEIVR